MAELGVIASVAQILDYSLRLFSKVAGFVHDVKYAPETKMDLVTKVTSLYQTLHAVNTCLRRWQEQVGTRPLPADETFVLLAVFKALERCEQTVHKLEAKIQRLGGSRNDLWNRLRLQTQLEIRGSSISHIEKSIDANLGSLQVLLPCLQT